MQFFPIFLVNAADLPKIFWLQFLFFQMHLDYYRQQRRRTPNILTEYAQVLVLVVSATNSKIHQEKRIENIVYKTK